MRRLLIFFECFVGYFCVGQAAPMALKVATPTQAAAPKAAGRGGRKGKVAAALEEAAAGESRFCWSPVFKRLRHL